MANIFILLFSFLCINSAVAQFNDTTFYYINQSSTGMLNKTNEQNAYVFNNIVKFNYSKNPLNINTTNSWIYGRQQHLLTNNDFSSILDFDLFKNSQKYYYWGLVNFDKSYSLKIKSRLQSGLGIGCNVLRRKYFNISLSEGILYERDSFFENENQYPTRYETVRNSFRVKFKVTVNNIFSLEGINYFQNSLQDRTDYIIKSNTILSFKLRKWLSFTSSFTYNKISVTRRENLLLNFGLTVERYF